MAHRLNLLNALVLDLFTKAVSVQSDTVSASGDKIPTIRRRLNLDIFEVPKGVRLFPSIVRLLFPVSFYPRQRLPPSGLSTISRCLHLPLC